MTSLGLYSEDALIPTITKDSVVVEVEHLTALSPLLEPPDRDNLGLATSEAQSSKVCSSPKDVGPVLPSMEHKRNEANIRRSRISPIPRLQRSTSLGHLEQERGGGEGDGSLPRRRDIGLRLPSFRGLGISSLEPKYLMRSVQADWQHARSEVMSPTQRLGLRSRPSSIYHHASEPHFGSTPLLTPPEDSNSIKWNNALLHPSSSSTSHCRHHTPHNSHSNVATDLSMDDNASGDSGSLGGQQDQSDPSGNISAPKSQVPQDSDSNNEAWLDRAIEETGA
jgi:hypothetical protein